MTAAVHPRPVVLTPQQACNLRALVLLLFLGLVSFAQVKQDQREHDQRECRPFAFGVSAFGSCDYLATTPPAE